MFVAMQAGRFQQQLPGDFDYMVNWGARGGKWADLDSEWFCLMRLSILREVSNRDKILSSLDMPVFLQWLYKDSLDQLLWK